jgi:hypothetical protein
MDRLRNGDPEPILGFHLSEQATCFSALWNRPLGCTRTRGVLAIMFLLLLDNAGDVTMMLMLRLERDIGG